MASRPLKPGDPRRLGDYRLIARLGEGGMGTVFLGRDPGGQPVAVKAIRPEYSDNEEFRARFRSEVKRALQVPSFCTAAVLDADPDSATPYLVVEYVDGPSLQEVVDERGPMSAGDLHSVAVGVAAALTAIHGAGVIHRDLKPLNVLLSLGLPKVIDFGIARALETSGRHTRTGHYVGTVDYIAPERLDPTVGPDSAAADIFAWGGVIAFAGTGHIPFYGDTPMAVAAQILTKPPDLKGLPDSLVDLVDRALTKDPRGRPTANELVQKLLAASGPGVLTPRRADPMPTGPPRVDLPRVDLPRVDLPRADLPRADPPASDAKARHAAPAGRFDARELLEQVIAEGPKRPSAALPPAARPRPREPRRRLSLADGSTRRLLYAVGALLLGSVTAATVAYARTGDDTPPTKLDTKLAPVTAPSLPAPVFADPLRAPGRLRETSGEFGSCKFEDGQLHARIDGRSTYQCPGPADTFAGDQTITVDVNLVTGGGCAMVWFRYHGDRGYQMTACANQIELEELNGVLLTTIAKENTTTLKPGTQHHMTIAVESEHATVLIDGTPILEAAVTDPDLASGKIQLGITNISATNAAEVAFSDLEVRAGS